ncbi:MFS transporter [Acinetobacter baumannii]|uniref:MFS transporter n=1 Tax=Acinetobacter TaxID=469 RepID=UPI0003171E13|nr:MFS transporter [Acinetobacter baumannii]UWY68042.1 MFS transporter [Acinetobacter baumannii]UWY73798.1 MFS transporter [Acinetobacter baumannii]UWY78838.1 MFS transporter [Acinetobacter baumannii]UWY83045.1 MFS transporter [Acinetobacter baumannii]UWY85167.1 MFS transporter [Acinetobacter baumannii]
MMKTLNFLSNPLSFFVASLSLVAVFITAGAPIPLFNIYQMDYGITNSDLGMISVAYFVSAAISLLILGRLSNYWGRKLLSLISLFAALLSCLLLFSIHTFWAIFDARILQGLACGIGASTLTAYVVDTSPAKLRWLATVITSSAPMIGIPLGAIGCGFLILAGTETRFMMYEIISILLVVLIGLTFISTETVVFKKGAIRSLVPQLYIPKHSVKLLVELMIASAIFIATWSLQGFYQAYGPAIAHNYLHTDNPILAALVFAAVMILTPLGSPLSRFFSSTNSIKMGMSLFIIALLAILLCLYKGLIVAFIIASLCVGIAQGLSVTGAMGNLLKDTEQQHRAGLLATLYLIAYCGAAIPALVASHFAKNVELLHIGYGYGVLGTFAAICALYLVVKK